MVELQFETSQRRYTSCSTLSLIDGDKNAHNQTKNISDFLNENSKIKLLKLLTCLSNFQKKTIECFGSYLLQSSLAHLLQEYTYIFIWQPPQWTWSSPSCRPAFCARSVVGAWNNVPFGVMASGKLTAEDGLLSPWLYLAQPKLINNQWLLPRLIPGRGGPPLLQEFHAKYNRKAFANLVNTRWIISYVCVQQQVVAASW